MRARILATVAAVAMVVGAIVVRYDVFDRDGGPGAGGDGANSTLVCARELPDRVCTEEEQLATTFDRLVQTDEGIAWVTPGPWPQMVDVARELAGTESRFREVETVATTDLVAIVLREPAQCASEVTWRCLGDAAGASGRVSGPSDATGARLLARAAMLGGFIGRADFASNDLDEVPGAREWIVQAEKGIEQVRARQAGTLGDFIAARGAAADVFITTRAEAVAANVDAAMIVVPSPRVVVVATVAGDADVDRVRDALVEAGWTAATSTPRETGLPSPGVLLALREVIG